MTDIEVDALSSIIGGGAIPGKTAFYVVTGFAGWMLGFPGGVAVESLQSLARRARHPSR